VSKKRHDLVTSLAKRFRRHGARVLKGDGEIVIEIDGGLGELRKVLRELRRIELEAARAVKLAAAD